MNLLFLPGHIVLTEHKVMFHKLLFIFHYYNLFINRNTALTFFHIHLTVFFLPLSLFPITQVSYHSSTFIMVIIFKKDRLVLIIFHFIMHTVKIFTVYVHILPKPPINVLHFFNENEERVVLYFEENEKAVVFELGSSKSKLPTWY